MLSDFLKQKIRTTPQVNWKFYKRKNDPTIVLSLLFMSYLKMTFHDLVIDNNCSDRFNRMLCTWKKWPRIHEGKEELNVCASSMVLCRQCSLIRKRLVRRDSARVYTFPLYRLKESHASYLSLNVSFRAIEPYRDMVHTLYLFVGLGILRGTEEPERGFTERNRQCTRELYNINLGSNEPSENGVYCTFARLFLSSSSLSISAIPKPVEQQEKENI